jgi:hypothetical protein
LKIPKGQSESVYRRRTDNTIAKRKKYKRTNNELQKKTTIGESDIKLSYYYYYYKAYI